MPYVFRKKSCRDLLGSSGRSLGVLIMISENFLKIPCNYPQIILKHLAKIFEEEQRLFKNLEGSSKISKDPLRIFKNLCKDLSSAHDLL